ncbi:hypothetical protein [Photorhabdus sp. CRCIA-P01]|uniref:hypothetical protein n=1 Tax=Photorhabdus sp. CRCIA-P01 TaxID=2019570 RepID=UPI000E59EDE3|nr:hypothetical protein [Photorhabdus sp. CRCIA-P01]
MSDIATISLRVNTADLERGNQELNKFQSVAEKASKAESGKSKPSAQVTGRLAAAMHVPFEWLAYGDTTRFENVKNESGEILYSIGFPADIVDMINEEARRLNVTI